MNKTNSKFFRLDILSIMVILYALLSIIRSLGLLYLSFTDSYFHNFDFEANGFLEKKDIYDRYYYFIPYILGLLIFLSCKKLFSINWGRYLLIGLFVILFFWLVDARFIRPLFAFFENTRINTFILITVFLILGIVFFKISRKGKKN